jgi:hypothetical protein
MDSHEQRSLVLGLVTRTLSVVLLGQAEVDINGAAIDLGAMHLATRSLSTPHIIVGHEREAAARDGVEELADLAKPLKVGTKLV